MFFYVNFSQMSSFTSISTWLLVCGLGASYGGPRRVQNCSAFRVRHLCQMLVLSLSGHVFLAMLLNFSEFFSHSKSMDNNSYLPYRLFVWIKINNVCKMPSNGAGTASIWETIVASGFSYNFHPCFDAGRGQEPQHACWIWLALSMSLPPSQFKPFALGLNHSSFLSTTADPLSTLVLSMVKLALANWGV